MFGTIARVTVQPGKEDEFLAICEQWARELGASSGQVAGYIFNAEGQPREYLSVAIFRDRDTYRANADDPRTDRWYRRLRSVLEADPEWNDGAVVQAAVLGGI